MKRITGWIILLIILGTLSLFFYRGGMKQFPRAIHAWAQSDRYALALNFENNHYNFFLPETYCLNPQFPAEHTPDPERGITRVDFPIHEYAIALIMKITGSSAPFIFRFYTLLWGLLGMLFLFQLTRRFTSSVAAACFVVVFAFTAPVYTYYQNGFLPSVPALSALLGGYFFFLRYRQHQKYSELIISIALFTLAALTRTPFVIFLIALTGQMVLNYLRNKKGNWKVILAPIAGFIIITGYFVYNFHLGKKYGSVFLSNVMPPASQREVWDLLKTIRTNWMYEYLTGWHYLFMGLLTVIALTTMIIRKKVTVVVREGWLHWAIAAAGVLFYFIFMMRQFVAHDYYILDTFFPLILLALILLGAALPLNDKKYRYIILVVFVIFSCLFVLQSQKIQTIRYTEGSKNPVDESIRDFTGAGAFLDQSGVPADARMLVLNSYSPNIPMILMNRKGYAVFGAEAGEALSFMNKTWDYAVVQENMPVMDLLSKDSIFYLKLERLSSNGYISVYRRVSPKNATSMLDFLQLDEQTITYSDSLLFNPDSLDTEKPYRNFIFTDDSSGESYLEMKPETEFVELLNASSEMLHSGAAKRLFISGMIRSDSLITDQYPELVFAINDASEAYVYYSFRITPYLKSAANGWKKFAFQYGIPQQKNPSDIIKLYWWNNAKGHYQVDNVRLVLAR